MGDTGQTNPGGWYAIMNNIYSRDRYFRLFGGDPEWVDEEVTDNCVILCTQLTNLGTLHFRKSLTGVRKSISIMTASILLDILTRL